MSGVIVVGAGPGLGASVAGRFAREGFGVGLVARRASTLELVRRTLTSYDVPVDSYLADAGDRQQLETALAAAVREHGAPEVVVYNAALVRGPERGELCLDSLAEAFAVDVSGALVTAVATIPSMERRGAGSFLLTGGMPRPLWEHLSLSLGKAALRALTTMLAEHYGPSGVHVATVVVASEIRRASAYDPGLIAEEYWRLHRQAPTAWQTERLFAGVP